MSADGNYLPRVIDERLSRALASFPIVVLEGPRGVGKTTTAERLATSTISLPQDAALVQVNAEATLRDLAKPVLIDEWQLAGTNFMWTLKKIVDADPTPGQFILTGSVEPATYGPTYPLTGRAVTLTMHPMNQAEIAGKGSQRSLLQTLEAGTAPAVTAGRVSTFSIDQLFTTGFPAARSMDDPTMFLEGYASVVSQRAGDEGRDSNRLLRTLRVMGVLTGQTVPDQTIWEAADINKATWKAYEDLLARVHLTAPLAAHSSNALSKLTNYPKRFLSDTALALSLAGHTARQLNEDPSLAGHYVESFVLQQLRPHLSTHDANAAHVRTAGGAHEVDLLIDLGGKRFAFEIKATQRPDDSDAKQLRWLQRELDGKLDFAAVLHTGGNTYPLEDNIWAIPIDLL